MSGAPQLKPYQFKAGQPSANPAGRGKNWLKSVGEKCHGLGIHPFDKVMELLPTLSNREQVQTWLELLSYCQPKPKQVEVERDPIDDMPLPELIKVVKEALPELEQAG